MKLRLSDLVISPRKLSFLARAEFEDSSLRPCFQVLEDWASTCCISWGYIVRFWLVSRNSSRAKLPLFNMSASWFLVSMYLIWILGPSWFDRTTNQAQLCGLWKHVSLSGFFPVWSSWSLLRCLQKCTTETHFEKSVRLWLRGPHATIDQHLGFPFVWCWICFRANSFLLHERNTSFATSHKSGAGNPSNEMISDSLELWNTDVCSLHIQLSGTNVRLPKIHKIPLPRLILDPRGRQQDPSFEINPIGNAEPCYPHDNIVGRHLCDECMRSNVLSVCHMFFCDRTSKFVDRPQNVWSSKWCMYRHFAFEHYRAMVFRSLLLFSPLSVFFQFGSYFKPHILRSGCCLNFVQSLHGTAYILMEVSLSIMWTLWIFSKKMIKLRFHIPIIIYSSFLQHIWICVSGPGRVGVFRWDREWFFFRHKELNSRFIGSDDRWSHLVKTSLNSRLQRHNLYLSVGDFPVRLEFLHWDLHSPQVIPALEWVLRIPSLFLKILPCHLHLGIWFFLPFAVLILLPRWFFEDKFPMRPPFPILQSLRLEYILSNCSKVNFLFVFFCASRITSLTFFGCHVGIVSSFFPLLVHCSFCIRNFHRLEYRKIFVNHNVIGHRSKTFACNVLFVFCK